ncbi:FKBP-type peptidyl-prolyl cis-trans isomerase [Streptomyces sp. NPDC060011]|uniref:FKBP-type peptidyl-prolyl cis-trans isomerase n=1 Tax=unclassified Streptomyces TaxID=2593676 RepID=UPI0013BAD01D|nr:MULTISPECIES: FKBP-type peptidyl-prolyl cis-trans isomerase [unclassified Streptomyces]NEB31549.1 FKBP-type peptidyl-prolyl cis-trans isomerase [Streptomyces sp. SID14446]MCX4913670.1 FKBP-type peptidyl-prolyl cis-trans isomerase [Streptomyces sp. NBC_00687]MCX5138074.1 FKBP-type peptidyl-prolyl cis-trans isomerase [Streptomyces sp. NBC_00340]MCX5282253.1 FKBP-type peptidyl-prolyl cis-trans isomerase [Streptomyces sp. NBC_00198]WSD80690.1 FKBP-type peptidyl-prolyl cis-trans isomerase [Strep
MRRRSLLIAVPAGLVTLAGCGDDDKSDTAKSSSSPSPSASASAPPPPKIVDGPLPAITAGTKFGEKPTVAKGSGDPSKDLAVKTVIAGGGKTVAENDYIQANYLGQVWSTAKVFDNSYDRKTPLVIQLAQGGIIDGWRYGLVGKKAGSRVEMSVPPTWGYGTQGNAQAGIKGTDTLVFVVDIENTFNSKSSAKGKDVPQSDAALPKVGTNTDGKAPSIDVPKADAPTKLVAEYVIEGDGETVAADSSVLVQYKGVLWDGGKEFDSTYSRGQLTSFSLQQVVKGWAQGLTGKKVGSRVLIVIPPKLGYGDKPPAGSGIKKDSTLVFSVDILAKM